MDRFGAFGAPGGRGSSLLIRQDPGNHGVLPDPEDDVPEEDAEERLVKALTETYNHEQRVREPHDAAWDLTWDRVHNHWDFSRKQAWQSQRGLPAMTITALRLAWEILKPLEEAGERWFALESENADYAMIAEDLCGLVRKSMHDDGGAQGKDFRSAIYQTAFGGLIMENMYLLVTPEEEGYPDFTSDEESLDLGPDIPIPTFGFGGRPAEEEPVPVAKVGRKFRIRYEALNPRYVWKDSTNRRRYLMWTYATTPDEFRQEGEFRGWRNIDETIESATSHQDEEVKDARDKDQAMGMGRRDTIHVLNYLGMLFDDKGHLVEEGLNYYVLGNDTHLNWGPEKNQFWHGEVPVLTSGLLELPFVVYHKSFLSLGVDPLDTWVEILNCLLDFLMQSTNPPTEVDDDQMSQRRGNQLAGGLYPGKLIHLEKGGRTAPAISRSSVPDPGSGVWQVLGLYRQEKDSLIGMSETGAMPRTRNRISAQEFKERSAASAGILRQVFKNLQNGILKPAVRQTLALILQKMPQDLWAKFWDERIKAVSDEKDETRIKLYTEVKGWNPRKRFEELAGSFRVEVKVYDALENRRETLEKLGMLTSAMQQNPILMSRVKHHAVAEAFVRALELNTSEFLWPNTGQTQETPVPPELAIQAAFPGGGGPTEPMGMVPPGPPMTPPG